MEDVLKLRKFDFPAPKDGACDVLVLAGEHSGDEQSARMLLDALEINPELKVCAFGGNSLAAAGAQMVFDTTSFSVVGLMEVVKNAGFFRALTNAVVGWIDRYRPKAVCFVDYPGFNLHIASILRKKGISRAGGGNVKTLYYISPQIWAWKASRRFKMARTLDSLATIFPFEPACYADTSLDVRFVGHPFTSARYNPPVEYDASGPILLLAGSRAIAVSRIFPVMVRALSLIPDRRATVICPSPLIRSILDRTLSANPDAAGRIDIVPNGGNGCIGACAVLTSSGTMSLSCALAGIPGAIVYRANPLTYLVGRSLVNIEYLGIANLILDKPAWREFIQFDADPKSIAEYIKTLLADPSARGRFAGYAARLEEVLKAPKNMSAAEWLLGNI